MAASSKDDAPLAVQDEQREGGNFLFVGLFPNVPSTFHISLNLTVLLPKGPARLFYGLCWALRQSIWRGAGLKALIGESRSAGTEAKS